MNADDQAEKIAELNAELTAAKSVRTEIATELEHIVASQDQVRGYLDTNLGASYLPGTDAESFELTPDFVAGVRFAIAALRDGGFEY